MRLKVSATVTFSVNVTIPSMTWDAGTRMDEFHARALREAQRLVNRLCHAGLPSDEKHHDAGVKFEIAPESMAIIAVTSASDTEE